jgi:REP element-mobilizing transposase RayT
MSNHVHLIVRSETAELESILRDLKKFTSKKSGATIESSKQESRKEWLL